MQAGHEFAARQRDEYETDCFTIPATNAPLSFSRRVASLFTRALNLSRPPVTPITLYLRIDVCSTRQIDQLGKLSSFTASGAASLFVFFSLISRAENIAFT